MLICQHILVMYDKSVRHAECAAARRRVPDAFALPSVFFSQELCCHCVSLRQEGTNFIRHDHLIRLAECSSIRIAAHDGVYDVCFTYHQDMGKPIRTYRHAQKPIITGDMEYMHSTLKENAFTLTKEKPYGRIQYNGRFSGDDIGQSYYKQSVINVFAADADIGAKHTTDLFIRQNPDFLYRQMEILYG